MPERAHYVITYYPERSDCWAVTDRKHDVVVEYYNRDDFDGAILRLRDLRGDLTVGDLT